MFLQINGFTSLERHPVRLKLGLHWAQYLLVAQVPIIT